MYMLVGVAGHGMRHHISRIRNSLLRHSQRLIPFVLVDLKPMNRSTLTIHFGQERSTRCYVIDIITLFPVVSSLPHVWLEIFSINAAIFGFSC